MIVVGSFFVVTGGIHLRVRGQGGRALKYAFSARRRPARKHHRHERRVDVGARSGGRCNAAGSHGRLLAAVLIIFCVFDSRHFRKKHPHTSAQTSPRPVETGIAMARPISFSARDSRYVRCRARRMARSNYGFNRRRRLPDFAAADSSRERIHSCADQRSGVDLSRHFRNDNSRSRLHGNARRPARIAFGSTILLRNGRALGVARQYSALSHFPRGGVGIAGSEHGQRSMDFRVHRPARSSPRRNSPVSGH